MLAGMEDCRATPEEVTKESPLRASTVWRLVSAATVWASAIHIRARGTSRAIQWADPTDMLPLLRIPPHRRRDQVSATTRKVRLEKMINTGIVPSEFLSYRCRPQAHPSAGPCTHTTRRPMIQMRCPLLKETFSRSWTILGNGSRSAHPRVKQE